METTKNVYRIHIKTRICNGCGDCVTSCPINTRLRMDGITDEKQYTLHVVNGKCEVINQDVCDGCGVCVEACSMKALKLEQAER